MPLKIYIFLCFFFFPLFSLRAATLPEKQKIFYLNSYDITFRTYESSLGAINRTFPSSQYILDVDFMDSKRFDKTDIFDNLKERIKIKLRQREKYDMILTSDDNALLFVLENHQELFAGTPVVFWGFDDKEKAKQIESLGYVTGVIESILVKETIDLIKYVQPDVNKLVILSDNTATGISDYKIYESVKNEVKNFTCCELYSPRFTVDQLQDAIGKLNENTAILKLSAYKLKDDILNLSEQYELLFKNSPVPVYCLGSSELHSGLTGGCFIDYYEHAVCACRMAKKILDGKPVSSLKIDYNFKGVNMMNYQAMQKYDIASASLPADTVIYGEPSNSLNIRKKVFFVILVFFFATLLLLGINIRLLMIKRKLADRLSISQQNYETLFRESPSVNLLIDPKNGKIVDANNAALNFYGYTIDEIRNLDFGNINTMPEIDVQKKMMQAQLSREGYVFTHRQKNGQTREVEIYTEKLLLENQLLLNAIVIDVTERLQAEKKIIEAKQRAEESDNLKTSFLANMSHEIRTPMNSILGFSDLLLAGGIQEEMRQEYLKLIYSNGQHLLSLINDIIDISKIEANQLKIIPEEIKVNKLLDELYLVFDNRRVKKNLSFTFELIKGSQNPDFKVFTDGVRLRQILTNLIENAFKFTEKGFVQFGYKSRDDGMLQFFVKDSGIGIPKEKHEVIFSVFQRIEDSYVRNYSGAGLGLSITRSLVEKLGGHIWLMSDIGIGSRFYFTLPATAQKIEI